MTQEIEIMDIFIVEAGVIRVQSPKACRKAQNEYSTTVNGAVLSALSIDVRLVSSCPKRTGNPKRTF